jgi:hypothetical protein
VRGDYGVCVVWDGVRRKQEKANAEHRGRRGHGEDEQIEKNLARAALNAARAFCFCEDA